MATIENIVRKKQKWNKNTKGMNPMQKENWARFEEGKQLNELTAKHKVFSLKQRLNTLKKKDKESNSKSKNIPIIHKPHKPAVKELTKEEKLNNYLSNVFNDNKTNTKTKTRHVPTYNPTRRSSPPRQSMFARFKRMFTFRRPTHHTNF